MSMSVRQGQVANSVGWVLEMTVCVHYFTCLPAKAAWHRHLVHPHTPIISPTINCGDLGRETSSSQSQVRVTRAFNNAKE